MLYVCLCVVFAFTRGLFFSPYTYLMPLLEHCYPDDLVFDLLSERMPRALANGVLDIGMGIITFMYIFFTPCQLYSQTRNQMMTYYWFRHFLSVPYTTYALPIAAPLAAAASPAAAAPSNVKEPSPITLVAS